MYVFYFEGLSFGSILEVVREREKWKYKIKLVKGVVSDRILEFSLCGGGDLKGVIYFFIVFFGWYGMIY